jgi:1,4-dihydroxy-2-naphthoyl-CoA hydrolase
MDDDPAEITPGGSLGDKLGIELLEVTAERVVARMPVEGNTQPFGHLHGGATAALAETLASVGGFTASGGQLTLGIEIKVNHLRSVTSGWVTGTAVPLHIGRTTQVWEMRIRDDEGRLTAFSTCTLAIRPLSPPA